MRGFTWNPAWEVGHEVIDRQHQGLFTQMGDLARAIAEGGETAATERTLLLLGDYIETHFRTEEVLMAEVAYPERERHTALHNALRGRVEALVAAYVQGHERMHMEVMDFLVAWLVEHLSGEDRQLVQFLYKTALQPQAATRKDPLPSME